MRAPRPSQLSPNLMSTSPGRRARRAIAVVLAVALAGGVTPAVAQQDWLTTEERREAEVRRQRQSELSGELDLLRISDAELEARSSALSAEVADLEERTAAATAELEARNAELDALREDLAAARRRAEERAQLARDRIVQAYMHPPVDTIAAVLSAADLTEAESRRALVDQVAAEDRRVVGESRRAAEELARLESETEGAATALREALAAQEADLARLRAARDEARAVAAALDDRIAAVRSEVASLAASEADLVALIASRQAAAATTTTTTTVPPTTAPPVPGTGGEGTPPTPPPTAAPPPPSGGGSLLWPTSGVLTSPYGWRWGAMHRGIDIGAPSGTPIYAAASGTVFFAGWMGGYGLLTLIDHGDGRVTAYAHQSSLVAMGGSVGRGQLIGYVGSTGDSTGPHLHFELRVNGSAVDPLPFLG